MAELTQPATVLSVTDLTPHVRQLVASSEDSESPIPARSMGLPANYRSVPNHPSIEPTHWQRPALPSGELTLIFDRVPMEAWGPTISMQLKPGDDTAVVWTLRELHIPTQLDRELLSHRPLHRPGPDPLHAETAVCAATDAIPSSSSRLLLRRMNCSFIRNCSTLAVTHPGFRYLPLVAAGGEQQGVDLTLSMLRPLIEGAPKVIPMLCGTKGFVRPLRAYFVEAGYDRKEVKTETYD